MANTFTQSTMFRPLVSNTVPPNWVIITCSTKVPANTASIMWLCRKFLNMLSLPSSLELKALNSWNSTNSVNTAVPSCPSSMPRKLSVYCSTMMSVMYSPFTTMRDIMSFVSMPAFLGVGLLSISPVRMGSRPSVTAGGPSIIRFIHSICSAVKGLDTGSTLPSTTHTNTISMDERLTVSWNWMKRWKFS